MEEKNSNDKSTILTEITLVQVTKNIAPSEDLGVSKEYNRERYDNVYKRGKFKTEHFGEKRTSTDYITGETLHIDTKASRNKYGDECYINHTADTDHIVPVKKVYKRLKSNPYLSDEDVREIANHKSNYRITQSKLNREKQDKSNLEFAKTGTLSSKAKARLIKDQFKAEGSLLVNASTKTAINVGSEFQKGAMTAIEVAAIPIMVEGVHNLILVANGDKEAEQAAKDMAELTTQIAVSGGGLQLANTAASNLIKNSNTELLKKIGETNDLTRILLAATIVKDATVKFVNDEIDGEEFFCEIYAKTLSLELAMIGGAIGTVAGGPLVGFISSMIISAACTEICEYTNKIKRDYKEIKKYQNQLAKVNTLATLALAEMEYQRETLREIINQKFSEWDENFDAGFERIFKAGTENDVDGVTEGLGKILNTLGEKVRYETFDEFDKLFMDEDSVFTF